ncbi:hypothetical protein ACP70R_019052 [Stipagrostis hirtigluma subsp. patula]
MAKVSPLHRAIDAGRWDAESLLGRLVVLVHAAFLDAGFVPCSSKEPGEVLPPELGVTASTLPYRYVAPQLPRRGDDDADAAVLRLRASGRHVVLYVQFDPRPDTYWVCVDAVAAAPLLSGGLDAVARALTRSDDARGLAALWGALSSGLCRRAIVDVCRRHGVDLEATLMSLPCDVTAAILARLPDAADLARVERACAGLRRLVASRDRELWKPWYEAMAASRGAKAPSRPLPAAGGSPETTSWKGRYVRELLASRARNWRYTWLMEIEEIVRRGRPLHNQFVPFKSEDRCDPPQRPASPVADRLTRRPAARGKRAARAPPTSGSVKRLHGAGTIHSPSSRYRWKHR